MVANKDKPHPGQILLINASKLCAKGRLKKTTWPPEYI